MIKIANFNSVIEIAFGLNALFFLFDLAPSTDERLRELSEKYDEAYKAKVVAGGGYEAFPVGLMISSYPHQKRLMAKITVIISLILLGFLIDASFVPNAEMSSRNMWILLIVSFGIPCIAIRICKSPKRSKQLDFCSGWRSVCDCGNSLMRNDCSLRQRLCFVAAVLVNHFHPATIIYQRSRWRIPFCKKVNTSGNFQIYDCSRIGQARINY
jgi:hypothetical protein